MLSFGLVLYGSMESLPMPAILTLGRMLSHSPHPRCKIIRFLVLRCCSLRMCLFFTLEVLSERIQSLCGHRSLYVREWVTHFRDAGMQWQMFPRNRQMFRRDGVRRNLCDLTLVYGSRGIPRGMSLEYFDNCCRDRYLLGWEYKDGVLRLQL